MPQRSSYSVEARPHLSNGPRAGLANSAMLGGGRRRATTSGVNGPRITTEGQVVRTEVGQTLLLPCRTRDLGPMILLWKKGTRVLTAGEIKVGDH